MLVLVFELAGHRFAVPAARVREVVRAVAFAPGPGSTSVVEGLVDLRGELIPVLDLRRHLGLTVRSLKLSDQLIVLELSSRAAALRVDAVGALLRIEAAGSDAPAPGPLAPSMRGSVRLADGSILLADPAQLLLELPFEALAAARAAPEVSR